MRRPGIEWGFNKQVSCWEEVNAQLLTDIRDELKTLNRLLHCGNFTGIPHTLKAIQKQTARKRKPKLKAVA